MAVGLEVDEFDPARPDVGEPFRSWVGKLMRDANKPRPDVLNAVRAGATGILKLQNWYTC